MDLSKSQHVVLLLPLKIIWVGPIKKTCEKNIVDKTHFLVMKMGVGFDFQNSILEKNIVPIRLESLYFISGCHNFQDISLHGEISWFVALICTTARLKRVKATKQNPRHTFLEGRLNRGGSTRYHFLSSSIHLLPLNWTPQFHQKILRTPYSLNAFVPKFSIFQTWLKTNLKTSFYDSKSKIRNVMLHTFHWEMCLKFTP